MTDTNDNAYLHPDAIITGGKSQEKTPAPEEKPSPDLEAQHAEVIYESTLKGVALARYHLEQAQKRAYEASLAYQLELAKRIEEQKLKRAEVLAELDRLRYDLAQREETLNETENAIDDLTEQAVQLADQKPPLINPEDYSV